MTQGGIFGWLGEKLISGFLVRAASSDPTIQVGQLAIRGSLEHLEPVFRRTVTPKRVARDVKRKLAEKMVTRVLEIAAAPDQRLANRKYLLGCVWEFAGYAVLVLNPPPQDDVTGLRGHPGISGELGAFLRPLIAEDQKLRSRLEVSLHYCPVKNLGNSIGYRRVQLRNRRPREKMPSGSRSFQKPPPKRPAAMCREAPPAGAVCARSQPAHRPKRRSRFASSRRSPTCHRTV